MRNNFQEYQVVELIKDLNPVITKGMQGVILTTLGDDAFIIEVVKEDGTNYEYNGEFFFTVSGSDIKPVPQL